MVMKKKTDVNIIIKNDYEIYLYNKNTYDKIKPLNEWFYFLRGL